MVMRPIFWASYHLAFFQEPHGHPRRTLGEIQASFHEVLIDKPDLSFFRIEIQPEQLAAPGSPEPFTEHPSNGLDLGICVV